MKSKKEILKMTKEELLEYKWSGDLKPKGNEYCSGCFDCSDCSDCFDCSDCSDCFRCSYCSGCSDCSGCFRCSYCYGCRNLSNKKYCICNIQLTKKEYEKKMKTII